MRTVGVLLLIAVALTLVRVASPASADCAQPTAPYLLDLAAEHERSVFVGSVVQGGGVHPARLAVDEVGSGPDLAPEVLVRAGPEQLPWPASEFMVRASSSYADLVLGEEYLVATYDDFATNACLSLAAGAEVLANAPPDARTPTAGGLSGHPLGLFDTALGATLLAAALGIASLLYWGRRLNRRGSTDGGSPGRRVARGAILGALIGLVGAGVAELATTATRHLFPTDVAIVGFTLVFGAPASVLVGALCWWHDRPASALVRFALAALPVVVVGAAQVAFQWSVQ